MLPTPLTHLRPPARRHAFRWPTWLWTAGAWVWLAQVLLQGDGGVAKATARAALGGSGEGLSTAWTPPVPAYHPSALTPLPSPVPDAAGQQQMLSARGAKWHSLQARLRADLDQAAAAGARPPWRRLVVEGTGEADGNLADLAAVARRFGWSEASVPHFLIGNGTRSGDGAIERTARLLDGETLVVSMVGDFSQSLPTPAQLRALTELVDYARAKIGMIPVELGDAARAPLSTQVLATAFNASLTTALPPDAIP